MIKVLLSAIFILLAVNVPLQSRDIDLDGMYLKKGSDLYRQITASKEKIYSGISSLFVDSNVIYAEWSSGDEIIYIKEFSGINIVYKYTKSSRGRDEVVRFSGNVTSALLNRQKNILHVKTLFYNDNAEAVSESLIVDINSGELKKKKSGYLFLDFTLHPAGKGIVYQTGSGIVCTDPVSGTSRPVVSKDQYRDVLTGGEPVLAYISPDEKKTVLVSGSGGAYRTKILTPSGSMELKGVSSGTDLRWIDSRRFVYRSGGGGEYSVKVFDINSGKSGELVSGTLNPDINYSDLPGIITCLDNQIIMVISRDLKTRIDTGIEGEESYFSPDGRKFTSIYLGKLYVNSLNMVEKYRIEIRRNAQTLVSLYKKASSAKSSWDSDYTPEYINKKIRQYEKFLRIN